MKTTFTFEIQYPASPDTAPVPAPVQDIEALAPKLLEQLKAQDASATVTVGNSHKGQNSRIVDIVTKLPDEALAKILEKFTADEGVTANAVD
ncbi:MAG: hypothetical protein EOO28_05910 [Comamonadaceae bacterium]|nr:MAG: hypothetical protein EOO28_05910 [Comamonadaceae bacterium]